MKDNRCRCSSTILFAIAHLGLLVGTGKSAITVAAQAPSTSSLRGEVARFSIEEDAVDVLLAICRHLVRILGRQRTATIMPDAHGVVGAAAM